MPVTIHDALSMQVRDVERALTAKLERLASEVDAALFDARLGRHVSTKVLEHRVAAVSEAVEILAATKTARTRAAFYNARFRDGAA